MEPVSVCFYLRASSDEQSVTSVPDQLKALQKEAARRNWNVVATYKDEGKSGSKEIDKRVDFFRMLRDSAKRQFTRIAVWDSSRFARLDSQKAATFKTELRSNGIEGLESLQEGFISWQSSMGRVMDSLLSEANHEYSIKLSANSIRGRVNALLERQQYPHGLLPLGFSKLVTDGKGKEIKITRKDKFRCPKGWARTIVIEEAEALLVRKVFDLFVNHSVSLRQIAHRMTIETGTHWNRVNVGNILRSKAYLGYAVISGKNKREVHQRMERCEVPNMLPRIIDEQLWHDAQRLLGKVADSRWRSQNQRVLTGLVKCGACGYNLVGRDAIKNRPNSKVTYFCGSSLEYSTSCPQWRIHEPVLLPQVVKELVKLVDAEVLTQLAASPTQDAGAEARQVVNTLREQVKRAVTRAAVADDDLAAELLEVAADLKMQLKQAEQRAAAHRHVAAEGGVELWARWWCETRASLITAATSPDDPEVVEELQEAVRRHPAFARYLGEADFDEVKRSARKSLFRVAKDGDTDPVLALGQQLFEGQSEGTVLDAAQLRGILRRLGCEIVVYWVPNPSRKCARDARWLPDRARLTVSFGGSGGNSACVDFTPLPRTVTIHFRPSS